MTFAIDKIDKRASINLKGWRIIREDGSVLGPFSTRREAEILIDFFGTPLAPCPCNQCSALREGVQNEKTDL